ncbi:MAG: NAD(P)/FAD-dependent oxidoreductase, partial [Candidatus Electrothrix sp. AR4]|nr:NAD(P)/FAD-dependent oxidoreductase [Candidatus Electrothrix sp. AR4]
MFTRRDFLRISAMASAAALMNWQCPALAKGGSRRRARHKDEYDAIIIGAGLGGLSCASFLTMNGFRPLVIDKRNKPGGYATSFQRSVKCGRKRGRKRGRFTCEASLHGVTGNPQNQELLRQLGVLDKLTLIPHDSSWSSLYPDLPLNFPQPPLDPDGHPDVNQALTNAYNALASIFSDEAGLGPYMHYWGELLREIEIFYAADASPNFATFEDDYPTWYSMLYPTPLTLDELLDTYGINDQKLRAILAQSWPYYGLPPSQIPAWLYLMYTGLYYGYGNFYIQGTSQSLSDALVDTIKEGGGKVLLNTEVKKIILDDNGRAVGVKVKNERRHLHTRHHRHHRHHNKYYANAVISNAAVPQTFDKLVPKSAHAQLTDYMDSISSCQPSTSHFNVWLGLDLDKNDNFKESYEKLLSNTIVYPGYDHDEAYDALLDCDPERSGFAVLAYDKLIDGFSPEGHVSITLSMLSAYEPWKQFEADYFSGRKNRRWHGKNKRKKRYYEEKKRITETLISLAEEYVLPGLSEVIVMKEASTPLTNVRFTLNTQGAIYGYDQTMDNSGF